MRSYTTSSIMMMEEEYGDEEQVSFLNTTTISRKSPLQVETQTKRFSLPYLGAMIVMSIFSVLYMLSFSERFIGLSAEDIELKPEFSCPAVNQKETNESKEDFETEYGAKSRNITTDVEEYKATFRDNPFDGWSRSYTKFKESHAPWVIQYFLPYLKPGAKVYESACGIGLNLLLVLEILQEQTGGAGITVYGNEYVPESVEKSEMVLGPGLLPEGNHRGIICASDSSNLGYVPSKYFDLVYTGYITPLLDPLDFGVEEDDKYDEICDRGDDWKLDELFKLQVKRERDWYGKWVGEMARIAKPGAPVIVENISHSYCMNRHDWGGVEEDFWREAAVSNQYDWNVDPESIVIAATLNKRYHVFMLKKET